MATQSRRNSKGYSVGGSDNGRKGSKEATPEFSIGSSAAISAPKYGTVVPERVFVGGISMSMLESELTDFFSKYGKVVDTKIIVDRAGVSKGYGFITFDTEEEAKKLLADADNIMLRERKLNIAPAIKKQTFNQRLEVNSGAASLVGAPLYGNGLPFTFHNGVTYFCHHPNSGAMSAPQPAAPQPPPPQPTAPPATPTAHLDPNLYTGYAGIQAAPPQYHQVVYNPPIYYQTAQYQYPITTPTCEAVEGSMGDGNTMTGGGVMGGGNVGQVMLTPNGYYFQEVAPYQEYAYSPHSYVAYQQAPDPQQPPHHVVQFSPATAPPPPPRPLYDSPILVPEQGIVGRGESLHIPPQQQQVMSKPKEPLQPMRPVNNKQPNYQHQPHPQQPSHQQQQVADTNNNQLTPHRPPFPHHYPNPNPSPLISQVYSAPQNLFPRPPTGATASSQPSYHHYNSVHYGNNSAGAFVRKYRRPYNPGMKGRGGGCRGGGSVSSYSSGGGGGGLVTPPSTPRSDQPSPENNHPPAQSAVSSQEHLVHSMKTLKAV